LFLLAGCGGKQGTLTIDLVVSPVDDPFVGASQVRFTVGSNQPKTFPVVGGHFQATIEQGPLKDPGAVLVDALDGNGNVVAYGKSPLLTLAPVNQSVAIWVGRPERVAAAATALPEARTEMATAAIPGLGVLYAGGKTGDGSATNRTAVYDVITHEVIETSKMQTMRAGAVGATVPDVRAIIFGGVDAAGAVTNSAEVFDPTTGLGLWSPAPVENVEPRAEPDLTVLASGAALISGGRDSNGTALASAALASTTGTVRITAVASPMAAARLHHAVAPAKFSDGEGAILFGGTNGNGPVAERLVGQSFVALDLPVEVLDRSYATASSLPSGDVLILGGASGGEAATSSGVLISVASNPPKANLLMTVLSTARAQHTATRVGNDLLVCGGHDATGAPLASCDLLDGTTLGIKKTIPLGSARRLPSAVPLVTGPIVLAGGVGEGGAPLASMEIYTP
jgi:hypothetical protein